MPLRGPYSSTVWLQSVPTIYLSIMWNSIRLDCPANGKVTKAVHKTLPRGVGGVGGGGVLGGGWGVGGGEGKWDLGVLGMCGVARSRLPPPLTFVK